MKLKNLRYGFSLKQYYNYFVYKITKKNKTILNYRPIWLLIYVSDLCNLRCEMCPHHSGKNNSFEFLKTLSSKYMSLEMLEKIYKRFPESIFVMLGGVGEPLLHPKFTEIIKLTAKYKKKINIITNGTNLNDEMIKFLAHERMINQISISLNASTPEEYSSICHVDKKMFEKTVHNIKMLVFAKQKYNANFEVVVSGVCSHEFLEKSYDFLRFCDSLNVDRIDLHRYIDFNIKDALIDIDDFSDELDKLYSFAKKNIKTPTTLPHKISSKTYKKKCDWYFKNLSFDSYGNMGSCGRVINPSAEYGNINDKNDIWNNEYMQKMRERFLQEEYVTEYCKKCVENHEEKFDEN